MKKEHRISVGAIVIEDGKVLLVRYPNKHGGSFLVGPGGGVFNDEGLDRAIVREVREETGLEVNPVKLLCVEDLLTLHNRMVKIWFLCNVNGGKLTETSGAREEGITGVGWYGKNKLQNEVVYPSFLRKYDWDAFSRDNWQAIYLELQEADF